MAAGQQVFTMMGGWARRFDGDYGVYTVVP